MAGLTQRDLRAVLDFLDELYACRDEERFPSVATVGLVRLVPAEHVIWNDITSAGSRVTITSHPELGRLGDLFGNFLEHMSAHPLIQYYRSTGDPRARSISDFVSARAFHRTEIYNVLYRGMGYEDQLAIWLSPPAARVIGIGFGRSRRGYSGRDRAVTELVRPHLARGWSHALGFSEMKRRLRAPERLPVPGSALGLTPREAEVLAEVEKGASNLEIADVLSISPQTVRKHLENIYRKLNVRSRTEALHQARDAAASIRHGNSVPPNPGSAFPP